MRVIVQLQEKAATELQQGQRHSLSAAAEESETKALTDAATELGVELQPLHPGQTHPLLASYFTADVQDRETAERVVNRLSQLNIVEAAYLKPDDEPP